MCIRDRISRVLLYKVARRAGIPEGVIRAYEGFQENMKIYNSITGGTGKPFKRKVAIPQGCPLSMMFVALIMRPWMMMIQKSGKIRTKILADDIFLQAEGKGMCQAFKAVSYTHLTLPTKRIV